MLVVTMVSGPKTYSLVYTEQWTRRVWVANCC